MIIKFLKNYKLVITLLLINFLHNLSAFIINEYNFFEAKDSFWLLIYSLVGIFFVFIPSFLLLKKFKFAKQLDPRLQNLSLILIACSIVFVEYAVFYLIKFSL